MNIGIDTFRVRLDAITWADVTTWNGGVVSAFAGRNFLGSDFLWGHAEATDALAHPNPEHPEQVTVVAARIAPIQRKMTLRQQQPGPTGFLFGQIDAHAICTRVESSIGVGEFQLGPRGFGHIWLEVDPDVDFTEDYWAGWSSTVNDFPMALAAGVAGPGPVHQMPFMAAILCKYTEDPATHRFKRDPHVNTVLAAPKRFGLHTDALAFWADAPDANGVGPNPNLDWNRFDANEKPIVWRFSTGLRDAQNAVVAANYDLDIVADSPPGQPVATDWMLVTQAWQPSRAGLGLGFSNNAVTTAAWLNDCVLATNLPGMNDSGGFPVGGGAVTMIGRYIKVGGVANVSLTRAEAETLSNAGVPMFTTWENFSNNVHGEPVWNDPANPNPGHIGIAYFRPAGNTGRDDATAAFAFAGNTLKQPPHTPIFFAVDGDPAWGNVIPGPHLVHEGDWIVDYFQHVHAARDAWNTAHPSRPYLIGVYGSGRVCHELYDLGIVDMFWQAMSPGFDESQPANHWWPWVHCNRWQYQGDQNFNCAHHTVMHGIDPDTDWGDGGTWILTDPLEQSLERLEAQAAQLNQLVHNFGDLLDQIAGH